MEAAKDAPERFAHLVGRMDRTGRINGAYRELKIAQVLSQYRLLWGCRAASRPRGTAISLGMWTGVRAFQEARGAGQSSVTRAWEMVLGPCFRTGGPRDSVGGASLLQTLRNCC